MKHQIESPTPFPVRTGKDGNALCSGIQGISLLCLTSAADFQKNHFVTGLPFCICKTIIIAYFLSN